MFNWKDRVYVNARKRVFKNLDTNEMLNLEIQDDEDNIETDSDTPLTAHCLNLAQQELVDDMSKTYSGTNITTDTIAGIGRINKVYGKTQEVGTGEKSPSNPYKLECVGNDVNLFDENNYQYIHGAIINSAGLISADTDNYRILFVEVKPNTQYKISFNLERSIVLTTTSVLPSVGVQGTARQVVTAREYTFTTNANAKYLCLRSVWGNDDSTQNYFGVGLKITTKWDETRKADIQVISKKGSNINFNIVHMNKPLCSLGNVRDEINYSNKKIIRRTNLMLLKGTENIIAMRNN